MASAAGPDFERDIRPLVKEYCISCHSEEKQKGDLNLEEVIVSVDPNKHAKIWEGVLEQINNGEMPPKKEAQLSSGQKASLTAWVRGTLDAVALERAGDPGPVVIRRLSNAEYTWTVRDLTGVESLDPAREFPVDGAAGEGFTNTGQALVMSPSLFPKYLAAAREIASHAVLLPDGIRFSAKTTQPDWTEEILTEIRSFYETLTTSAGGATVTKQGIALDQSRGGTLALDDYFAAAIGVRDQGKSIEEAARARGVSAKYLDLLSRALQGSTSSPLMDNLRSCWRSGGLEKIPALLAEISQWQESLWKFSSVGHIGKAGGPTAWMEPVTPLLVQEEFRVKPVVQESAREAVIYLSAGDAGDGSENDSAVWRQPAFILPGKAPLLLRDVPSFLAEQSAKRDLVLASTAAALLASDEMVRRNEDVDMAALAESHDIDPAAMQAWFDFLGTGSSGGIRLDYLTTKLPGAGEFDFVQGWGSPEMPGVMANASDKEVRIPGLAKPHGVVVHPSPTLAVGVGWKSPMVGRIRVEATVRDAHLDCGNGVTWSLELRQGKTRRMLAEGVTDGGNPVSTGPISDLTVQPGDLLSILIGPRDGEHTCDLTDLELNISSMDDASRKWSLTADVNSDILSGNPHADRNGNQDVWHFYSEPVEGVSRAPVIPAGSTLARWQAATQPGESQQLAGKLQKLLTSSTPPEDSPDAALYAQLTSLNCPLFSGPAMTKKTERGAAATPWGVDPSLFGTQPGEDADLHVKAPSVVEIRLPAEFAETCEFVTTGVLDPVSGAEGSVQLQVLTAKPAANTGLQPGRAIVVNEGSQARKRIAAAFDEFRDLFPPALCYTKIVPVDEVVTLTLFHREDNALVRLVLSERQKEHLDRMWSELHFVSQDALTMVDVFEQLWQYATQDADPSVFTPVREPIRQRAETFKKLLTETEPRHLDSVLEFAGRAYRRPLTETESKDLISLYHQLREQEMPHDPAIRLLIVRVLVSPAFLYRGEKAQPGAEPTPVNDWELASRLSYFLWSSMPDAELISAAESGTLHEPDILVSQTRRMLRDLRVRRMATEFGCSWLHIHGFDEMDEKSERHFPTFKDLRGPMYEETRQFFTDLLRSNDSVLSLLNADHTFLNDTLASHYGIPGVTGAEWRRVDGVQRFGRGGVLSQGATLSRQSGASRTSPILRGNWIAETMLGDRLPRPPRDVPPLPEEMANESLTVRQLTEQHSSDPRCSGCHVRIDAFGFALENYDAIGRFRTTDLGNHPIDPVATVLDGSMIDGLDGLRSYLLGPRREDFLHQFCRKLLGYSLGRSVQLSDEPLIRDMIQQLEKNGHRVHSAVEMIVLSRQFREIRGRDAEFEQ